MDMVKELKEYNIRPDVVDPWCSAEVVQSEYNLTLTQVPKTAHYDAIMLAVAHDEFEKMGYDSIRSLGKKDCVLYDLKEVLPKEYVDIRL
jgi:UDP-N-acetyl-D-galactosamine dehydrogenase